MIIEGFALKAEFEFLVKLTQSNSLDVRLAAIGAIAKTTEHKAFVISTLSNIIKFGSAKEKCAAIQALGELGSQDAIRILVDEIQTPNNHSIKKLAITALGEAIKKMELNELQEDKTGHEQKLRLRVM
ncbi:hypothetical protein ABW55_15725 [Acinetobacter sp. C15]|uniref:HEAT repeat domain-containing protein n=1 Tax=Acinetobacter TaxID=469 RepID=UPI000660965C|nr:MULTISPECIES: HEAT repeat domain-containing protein [Acinetobacter]KOR10939.1 hypothetical protein ABW55_15725 [Acinetobacter sp. C15]